jgi:hypothetical protein
LKSLDLKNNYRGLVLIAVAIILVLFGIYKRSSVTQKAIKWHFSGPVENVRYDVKKYPWVIINGIEFNLYYTTWDFNVKINKGDTLIKQVDDIRIKLIRQGTHDTISFNKRVTLAGK